MATELGSICCAQHGEQDVVDYNKIDSVRTVALACKCDLQFDVVGVGDAVLYEGELFTVTWVGPGPAFDELSLKNNDTTFFTESYCVSYVAKDTLSPRYTLDMQTSKSSGFDMFYGAPRGPSRYFSSNEPPAPKPRKKTHAISTADLIKTEVKSLETRQPSSELAESVAEGSKDDNGVAIETGPIPRRDGDW